MRVAVYPANTLADRVIHRHLARLGHQVLECDFGTDSSGARDAAPSGADAVVLNLTAVHSDLARFLGTLRPRAARVPRVTILRQDQALETKDALRFGVHAILHEPLHLEELELALARTRGARGGGTAKRRPRPYVPQAMS